MTVYLDKYAVAERLGVRPKTAAAYMMEMNPIPISGTVRKRYRVKEENLEAWAERRMINAPKKSKSIGSNKRLGRK